MQLQNHTRMNMHTTIAPLNGPQMQVLFGGFFPSLGWLLPKLPPHLSPTLAPRGHRPTLLSPKHGPDKDSDAHLGPGWLAEMEPPGDVDGDGAEVMKE